MKILHYSLGLPPYRSGGLTKYCLDLMKIQKKQGDEVALLWPGRMSFAGKAKVSVKKSVYAIEEKIKIASYELCNPLPVPLDEGIKKIDAFTASCDIKFYYNFLKEVRPDVIHIHTLMGIHKEFILAAKELHIRTVFTTHDYFGLCPKVTLFCNGQICNDKNCNKCVQCNQLALSLKKIKFMQSKLYRKLKNTKVIKKVRMMHRKKFFEGKTVIKNNADACLDNGKNYRSLRQFYISLLLDIDMIHFNSTVSEKIYKSYFKPKNSVVINVVHGGIADHRKSKYFNENKLRIIYLAAPKPFKGFQILIQALDELWAEGKTDFVLYCYSLSGEKKPYLHEYDGFSHDELPEIFSNADILVAPSLWYETFGFTVLEALSYGVPVIVSENVGAKDIIPDGAGIVMKSASAKELRSIIEDLTTEQLQLMNEKIVEMKEFPDPLTMANLINKRCYTP